MSPRRVSLAIAVILVASGLLVPTAASAAQPGFQLGINPEFASPTTDTPAGVQVDSASLIENANAWNGHIITFRAEAIGERMVRGSWAWIHANDDAYMFRNLEEYPVREMGKHLGGYNTGQAIWISAASARKIRYFGDYAHEGDIIVVRGVFNAACRLHGGDMDIHADSLDVARVGHTVDHVFNTGRAVVALLLLGAAAVLYLVQRAMHRRRI